MEQKIKFSRSQKVYLPGKLYPNIRVAMAFNHDAAPLAPVLAKESQLA